jgi:alkylation response protein AidB-like acyl-CoA dehydrogenase
MNRSEDAVQEASSGYMTDERRMIQEVARDFTMKEVLPVANELDPVQGDIPMELREKMGEMGYFGIRIPGDSKHDRGSGPAGKLHRVLLWMMKQAACKLSDRRWRKNMMSLPPRMVSKRWT